MSLRPLLIVLVCLLLVYVPTLQTIPNGSDHYYMIDVGETQVVLNVWGTLHATGYPLYVLVSAALVAVLKLAGVSAAAAPAVVSLIWGLAALSAMYALALHLTRSTLAAGLTVLLFGLTRTVWIHQSIAEIYSFGLLITVLLFTLALWKGEIRHRVFWLALIGGIGVGHHRAVIFLAPALLYTVWPELGRKRLPRILIVCLLIGLIGLLPYVYLPLRAGADWVYGDPGTLTGLWDQFSGREASRFIGVPSSIIDNLLMVSRVLLTDLTAPGVLLGLIGLVLASRTLRHRRAAVTFLISGVVSYLFHVLFYSDVLSALILQVTLSVAFGWLFLIDWMRVRAIQRLDEMKFRASLPVRWAVAITAGLMALLLIVQNFFFIRDLTQNTTGLDTIRMARQTPAGSTLMIPWGMRHFAVGFARSVWGELSDVTLVDHKADFQALVANGRLITLADTFYTNPVTWWEQQLNQRVYLHSAASGLVEISTHPETAPNLPPGISVIEQDLICTADMLTLYVAWASAEKPSADLSVFVHLLDSSGAVIAQADQSAPVYGWRPLTGWRAGEVVRDIYALPRREDAALIRYGLYRQLENGEFRNEAVFEVAPECESEA